MSKIEVSIIIVCMNNLKNLYPCLDSIQKYTTVNYEVIVVTYLFTKNNLEKLQNDYPWIKIIESNRIRGFAENNNLAIKEAKGKFLLISNDDIEFKMPVVDKLIKGFDKVTNAAIISPVILNTDGSIQNSGKAQYNTWDYLLHTSGIRHFSKKNQHSKYCYQKGLFKTFNISGAFFMIRNEVMKELGYFDEKYFFCPEDIALSTLANKKGYYIYVDSSLEVYHHHGKTSSNIKEATTPAMEKGNLIFFTQSNKFFYYFVGIIIFSIYLIKLIYAIFRKSPIMRNVSLNVMKSIFSSETPKDIFIKYYKTL